MAAVGEIAPVLLSTPKKCVHLHLYQTTKRWGAWVKDKRINNGVRLFVGTHKTKYLAARCQDRAMLMIRRRFRGGGEDEPLKLNFKEADYEEDEELRTSHTVEAFIGLLISESREAYNTTETKSKCLEKFLADVEQGRVADEIIEPLGRPSRTEEFKNIKLQAKPDRKGKNKVSDTETQNGEPSEDVAPNHISDEEMAKLFAANQYCAICKKVWLEDEDGDFVQCDICILWVHAPCANITKEKMKELGDGASYHCPDCERAHIVNISSQDRQNLDVIKLADRLKEKSEPTDENLPQSTTAIQPPTRTSRGKRISDNTAPAAKVAKTCDSRPDIMSRPAGLADVDSTSSEATRRRIADFDLNLPSFADAELSEEHQAASILYLLKHAGVTESPSKCPIPCK